MTHDLVERLRDSNYSGSMQHLRSYDEIDRLFNQAADKLEAYMAEIAALRAEKDEIRKAVIEEAAAICERQAKYFRDLSNDPSCLSDIRWNSKEEARHTMQSYAERHETDAAAIRNMGERE